MDNNDITQMSSAAVSSFQQLMDEQLAQKLQEEENSTFTTTTTVSTDNVDELSKVEEINTSQEDADLIMALQLQAQFDAEEAHQRESAMRQHEQYSKVRVCSNNTPLYSFNSFGATKTLTEEDDEEDYDDYSDEEQYDSFYNEQRKQHGRVTNGEFAKSKATTTTPTIITKHDSYVASELNKERMTNFPGRVAVGDIQSLKSTTVSTSVYNSINENSRRTNSSGMKIKSKKDRATHEQVMDQRTRLSLQKLVNSRRLQHVEGVISTGKEANVYFARGFENVPCVGGEDEEQYSEIASDFAVKIYRTTLNEFKDREAYFRTSKKFAKKNTFKLIKLWAEKEMLNLFKLQRAGIPSPAVIELRDHILVMSFLGKNGKPAPQLRTANISNDKLHECYLQCVKAMRTMYHSCKLVHADLSEYNILYFKGKLWFIDVAQAVPFDDPNAMEFLRRDCKTITNFFYSSGVKTAMTSRELFSFVTDASISDIDDYLQKMQELILNRGEQTEQEKVDDAVFQNSFIPRTLADINDPIAELEGDKEIFHQPVTGMGNITDKFSAILINQEEEEEDVLSDDDDDDDYDDDDDDDDCDDDEEDSNNVNFKEKVKLTKEERREQRKAAKKQFKAKQRERRAKTTQRRR